MFLGAVACDGIRMDPSSKWSTLAAAGKTVVSSALISRVARNINRPLYDAPVGFKWFVVGRLAGTLGFAGEKSVGDRHAKAATRETRTTAIALFATPWREDRASDRPRPSGPIEAFLCSAAHRTTPRMRRN